MDHTNELLNPHMDLSSDLDDEHFLIDSAVWEDFRDQVIEFGSLVDNLSESKIKTKTL